VTAGERAWLVIAAVAFVIWLAHAAVFPYVRCRLCKGRRTRSGGGRTYMVCPACQGRDRLRLGARWVRPDLRKGK
jgi:hypothetical protein